MSFPLSLSGLTTAARAIDVVGHNIANLQTNGFKSSKARFADVYGAHMMGGLRNSTSFAQGVQSVVIDQNFSQAPVVGTERGLDMAISGNGFFRLDKAGEITYTRNGNFALDFVATSGSSSPTQAYLVSADKRRVTGLPVSYGSDPQGTIDTAAKPTPIVIEMNMPPQATTKVAIGANLNAQASARSAETFDPAKPETYNSTTGTDIFDADGVRHTLELYFVKTEAADAWKIHARLDKGTPIGPFDYAFGKTGLSQPGQSAPSLSFTTASGGSVGPITLDMGNSTQYGVPFSYAKVAQEGGFAAGTFNVAAGLRTDANGELWASYDNGQSRRVGQVVLANFTNANALLGAGDGQWIANGDPIRGTGQELIDIPGKKEATGDGGMGALTGSALEISNVDLDFELVSLIELQRNYQANAQSFKILDQVLQNLADKVR